LIKHLYGIGYQEEDLDILNAIQSGIKIAKTIDELQKIYKVH